MPTTFTFEFDWDNNGSWTDESGEVLSAKVRMGMAADADPFDTVAEVGTAEIRFDNSTQRYSPDYGAGPLFGKLVPRRQFRLRATDGVTIWTVFRGYVDSIQPDPGPQSRRQCVITCVDFLALLRDFRVSLDLQQNKRSDQLIAGIVNLALNAPAASGTITFSGQPADNDTVTINSKQFRFKNTLAVANDVKIGTAAEDSAINLRRALNLEGVSGTHYGAGTTNTPGIVATASLNVEYPSANQDSDVLLASTVGTQKDKLAQSFQTLAAESISQVKVYLKKIGTPTGTLTVRLETDSTTGPSGLLIDPNATTTLAESSLTTSYALVTLTLPAAVVLQPGVRFWIVLSTSRAASGTNYIAWGADGSSPTYTNGEMRYLSSGVWNAENKDAIFSLGLTTKVTVTATLRGAVGNAFTLAKSSANLSLSGSTFSGGADYPAGLTNYRAGHEGYDVSADRWLGDETFATQAIRECSNSEQGRFFVQRNGTVTFLDRLCFFSPLTNQITLNISPFEMKASTDVRRIANQVKVTVHPRATAGLVDVIATSATAIRIPPKSATGPGIRTVTMRFRNAVGEPIGATGVVVPLTPTTDYLVNDRADGQGFDYTNSPSFQIGTIEVHGSEVVIPLINYAIGPLFVTRLQVRGLPITTYDPITQVQEDAASQSLYLRRIRALDLPLSGSVEFGEALAHYVLGRYKAPFTLIESVKVDNQPVIGGVNLFSIDLFQWITATDSQTGISNMRLFTTGYEFDLDNKGFRLILFTARADDTSYWNLGTTGYGELDTATRLAV